MVLTVRFKDNTFAIQAKIAELAVEASVAAAEELSEQYKYGLATPAPPHSSVGGIPHAYLGWKPGGYGPTNPTGVNNIPPEFASEQVDFLKEYIGFARSSSAETLGGVVGFSPSHVAGRSQNYLLDHDRSGRPWVRPLYDRAKTAMINAVKAVFRRGK